MGARPEAGRFRFLTGDVADLPLPDNSVDLVVSTLSAHEWPDPEAAAASLRRVGAHILIYDFRTAGLRRLTGALGGSREPRWWLFTRISAR
nr:methyltransferase domain-containing protein [Actinoplanes octamycinicus]